MALPLLLPLVLPAVLLLPSSPCQLIHAAAAAMYTLLLLLLTLGLCWQSDLAAETADGSSTELAVDNTWDGCSEVRNTILVAINYTMCQLYYVSAEL
jgi:hypothetical protein